MNNLSRILCKIDACESAIIYAGTYSTWLDALANCHNWTWVWWLAVRLTELGTLRREVLEEFVTHVAEMTIHAGPEGPREECLKDLREGKAGECYTKMNHADSYAAGLVHRVVGVALKARYALSEGRYVYTDGRVFLSAALDFIHVPVFSRAQFINMTLGRDVLEGVLKYEEEEEMCE